MKSKSGKRTSRSRPRSVRVKAKVVQKEQIPTREFFEKSNVIWGLVTFVITFPYFFVECMTGWKLTKAVGSGIAWLFETIGGAIYWVFTQPVTYCFLGAFISSLSIAAFVMAIRTKNENYIGATAIWLFFGWPLILGFIGVMLHTALAGFIILPMVEAALLVFFGAAGGFD